MREACATPRACPARPRGAMPGRGPPRGRSAPIGALPSSCRATRAGASIMVIRRSSRSTTMPRRIWSSMPASRAGSIAAATTRACSPARRSCSPIFTTAEPSGSTPMLSIEQRIAEEIAAKPAQVQAAVELLDGGATVPFIARYRKEATGGLDDTQLRLLEERLRYLRELEERREAVLASIAEQGKLDDALKAQILEADTKARLEDLYLPYKPKRRTKAQIAREAGLQGLADALRADPMQLPDALAAHYVDAAKNVADVKAALDGARAIVLEEFSEDAALVGELREWLWQRGHIRATVVEGKQQEGAKYSDYFDYDEAIRN